MAVDAKIVQASEDSLQIQFEQKICPEVNSRISAFVKTFEYIPKDIAGVLEVLPTYCSVSIYFDEAICQISLLKDLAQKALQKSEEEKTESTDSARTITINKR